VEKDFSASEEEGEGDEDGDFLEGDLGWSSPAAGAAAANAAQMPTAAKFESRIPLPPSKKNLLLFSFLLSLS
jgi:hypothetical protein